MIKENNKVKVDSNDVIQGTVIAFLHNSAANNACFGAANVGYGSFQTANTHHSPR